MIIGLDVRHYKAYKNIKFIPIGSENNFTAFAGENGVGKSSILEALDTFLNNKNFLLTKEQARKDAYIVPIFLIPKGKATRLTKQFENISDYFWNLEQKGKDHKFFNIRDKLIKEGQKENNLLLFIGEDFERNLKTVEKVSKIKDIEDLFNTEDKFDKKNFLKELKEIYSYIYVPVEIDSEKFTKIETEEMQKVFNKKIRDEIKGALKQGDINTINAKLDGFVSNIESNLDDKYFYDTGDKGMKKLTQNSLVDTILESYFKKRVLMSGQRSHSKKSKKMSELSAGEKREALINLLYVFLKEEDDRDKIVIIGIDEPENSLHTSICYNQFEKLKRISKEVQVLITTHWYGFLPIIDKATVHFLKNKEVQKKGEIEKNVDFFHSEDLSNYTYKLKNIPNDFRLKSTYDLVQSIVHSLKADNEYNWLIVEGESDKVYLESFLETEIKTRKLRIIAVGWV